MEFLYGIINVGIFLLVLGVIYLFHDRHYFDQSPKWRIIAILVAFAWVAYGISGDYNKHIRALTGCYEEFDTGSFVCD